ncbi:MAG TPA: hypothetical protein VGR06_43150 [Actinophytocola sp.]|jgi:hypothetical protein|uniref:hypothetical protein n=1 Tax=Actinophytocola sp. TaxID=1872138 RepID=UPI002DFD4A22|nr:hypothetical protein [Actinophytocola sp.]
MSINLYTQPGVYQMTWIEMKPDVAMRYEVDHRNEAVALYFGSNDEWVINIGHDNLDQLLQLATAAKRELSNPPPDRHGPQAERP